MFNCVVRCEKNSPMLSQHSALLKILSSISFQKNISFFWVDASYSGLKIIRVPIPKIHINEKKTIMEKNVKNQC
jgi:hypothetical protein